MLFSTSLRTSVASFSPPSPPFAHTSERATFTPSSLHFFSTSASSAAVSVGKALIATTAGRPNTFVTFSTCLRRFGRPFSRASRFSLLRSAFATPPLYLSALTVATITTAFGLSPARRHLMSRNFSAPRSAPKPASVMVMSASYIAVFVARTLLHPCAIFANGPPCTMAGVCSRV